MGFKTNVHDWAVDLTKREGLKRPIDVANAKEFLRLALIDMANATLEEREKVIARYVGK